MTPWENPPLTKVFEALGVLGDQRITQLTPNHFQITSSSGNKIYDVIITDSIIDSNDNLSFWKKQLGYPALSVLMLLKKLPRDPKSEQIMSGIPWKEINQKHKNNFDQALSAILETKSQAGFDTNHVKKTAENIHKILQTQTWHQPKNLTKPPSGW